MAKFGGAQPGAGRPKGVPNKNTGLIKDMILGALDKAGGIEYLYRQAEANPGPFMTLVGKVLPTQIVGANDGPVMVITGVARAEDENAEATTSEVDALGK